MQEIQVEVSFPGSTSKGLNSSKYRRRRIFKVRERGRGSSRGGPPDLKLQTMSQKLGAEGSKAFNLLWGGNATPTIIFNQTFSLFCESSSFLVCFHILFAFQIHVNYKKKKKERNNLRFGAFSWNWLEWTTLAFRKTVALISQSLRQSYKLNLFYYQKKKKIKKTRKRKK